MGLMRMRVIVKMGCDNEIAGSETVTVVEGDPGSVRIRGQVERERLMNNMK